MGRWAFSGKASKKHMELTIQSLPHNYHEKSVLQTKSYLGAQYLKQNEDINFN
jgi:hypothetical protein